MKKLIFSISIVFILLGCATAEPDLRTECQKQNIGYFIFDNTSKDSYSIFVDNVLFQQQPGNTVSGKIKYASGKTYTIKVQQVAGYILYPTVKTYSVTLNQCDQKTITYP